MLNDAANLSKSKLGFESDYLNHYRTQEEPNTFIASIKSTDLALNI